jgi:hypothetical protein
VKRLPLRVQSRFQYSIWATPPEHVSSKQTVVRILRTKTHWSFPIDVEAETKSSLTHVSLQCPGYSKMRHGYLSGMATSSFFISCWTETRLCDKLGDSVSGGPITTELVVCQALTLQITNGSFQQALSSSDPMNRIRDDAGRCHGKTWSWSDTDPKIEWI